MAKRIYERVHEALNEQFRERLKSSVAAKFDGLAVTSRFDFCGVNRLVTTRDDGEPFTPEQAAFIEAYEKGFQDAWNVALRAATT